MTRTNDENRCLLSANIAIILIEFLPFTESAPGQSDNSIPVYPPGRLFTPGRLSHLENPGWNAEERPVFRL